MSVSEGAVKQNAQNSAPTAAGCRGNDATAWNDLGQSLQQEGKLIEALQAFRNAVQCNPAGVPARVNLGTLLFALDQNTQALEQLRHALAMDPRNALAHGNLGALLARAGCPVAAESASRTAIALDPNQHRWLTNLAVALFSQGRHAEAEQCYRKALAMRPDYATGHGNLLFALNYRTDITAEAIIAEYREWDHRHARPLGSKSPTFQLDRNPGRRLRIGYVSADFRQHAVAMFAEPLFTAHDRTKFDLYLYASVAAEDATTERFRSIANHWRNTIGLSDERLAELIRADRIDVLIDLSGHSAGNRLLTFARRAAPVQIAYLLGHGYSTGLSAMDAFLADPYLAPVGTDALFSERVIRLPRIPIVYAPPSDMPPVTCLPAKTNGYTTFGHFGRTERLNEAVVGTWARILQAIPQSQLVLNNRPFQEAAFRNLTLARFAEHGIEPSRLNLIYTQPRVPTWAAYGQIDIALDPFPHNAGTTTIEALWQGVPVVSLAGRPTVGRFGASILHAVGLDDWVTTDPNEYVARAVAAASDVTRLAQLRSDLRQRVANSTLCDAQGLARLIEATFRKLWGEWCEGDVTRLHQLYAAGDSHATTQLANRLLQRDEANADAHHILGLLAYRANRFGDAHRHLQAGVAQAPASAELQANHAAVLRKLGRLMEAESAARTALALEPQRIGAHNNLGNILRDAGRYDESADSYRAALRLSPNFCDAWVNLSWVLTLTGQAQQAEEAARRAIECDGSNADAHNNLGLALMRQGRIAEAEQALRQALALRPAFALPHSNILFCLNYSPNASAEDIFAEYRRWDHQHAQPLQPKQSEFALDRSPTRRLRIGYVSPDFRQHAVSLFAEPLIAAHDRSMVEVYCYAEVPAPDAATERFRALAHHWRSTVGMSDAAVAEQIRRDQIDILVDLAGHTAGNRLLAFARKPAPIQVEWLLGHGYSSGLTAMDVFLADEQLAPIGSEHLFSERVVRLSRIPLAYSPPAEMPDVAPLPAQRSGFITFGYFGRTVRLNDSVITTWARILRALPSSRLMLNNSPFSEPTGRTLMESRFAAQGIEPARLILTYTSPQSRTWAAYGGIDIALDPFPHNAGTTTIEALWQGVPVVSLAGRPTVGRFGASILHAVGLDDWLAPDVEAYVARALAAASNLSGLAQLRGTLRSRFSASPLCDAIGLAHEVEAAYRRLWQDWCNAHEPDVRQLYASGGVNRAANIAGSRLALNPEDPVALHVGALVCFNRGDPAKAAELLQRSVDILPDAAVWSDLGVILRSLRRFPEAEIAYRKALAIDPSLVQALGNLGNVLLDQNRPQEAEATLSAALQQTPGRPWLLRNLALSLIAQGAVDRAETALRQALATGPDDADVHDTLGGLLAQSGRPIEAEQHYRAALARTRQRHRVLSNMATVLNTQGRHFEADRNCREALAIQPEYAAAHCNRLFALNYRSDLSAEAIFTEYRNWDSQLASKLAPVDQRYPIDRSKGRRLRVGYVSADFRQHTVAWFTEPLLAAHDHASVELFCYAHVGTPDVVTRRFQAITDHWRDITGVDDETVAATIRQDHIDVLVDLTGHTAGSRLLIFARKPAPVQVEYLLGHGYSSGLSTMDAFLADAALAPPNADAVFSERIIRLPRIPLAYIPPDGMPSVTPLPALRDGRITFGYFGRPERLNEDVIATWTDILHAVPESRLVLNSRPFRELSFGNLMASHFAAHGIDRTRLEFIATASPHATWRAYGSIDIALDPFPHNAGTTTIEALWHGIPVISLASRPSVGRFGAMILHAVGMDEWVAQDSAAYIADARRAAGDLSTLARLRSELRTRVASSPLCDASDLARHVEAAYRELWEAWRTRC